MLSLLRRTQGTQGSAAGRAVRAALAPASTPAPVSPFTSTPPLRGMEEFFAPPLPADKVPQRAGRAWTAAELRIKSFEDLHCLWFICLKERNYLLTERLYFRQMLQAAPDGMRLTKVKRTMGAIRLVVRERARAQAALAEDEERRAKAVALAGVLSGTVRSTSGPLVAEGVAAAATGGERVVGGSRVPSAREGGGGVAAGAAVGAAPGASALSPEAALAADKQRAIEDKLQRLKHVKVTFKRFGRKYTLPATHPAVPTEPTRAARKRVASSRAFFAKARAQEAAPPTLPPPNAALVWATTGVGSSPKHQATLRRQGGVRKGGGVAATAAAGGGAQAAAPA